MKTRQPHPKLRFIKLSLSARYAIEGMTHLARNGSSGFIGAGQTAKRRSLPAHFLMKVLRKLAARGLVESRRGPGGGFLLKRDPRRIRVWEIVDAADDKVPGRKQCLLGANGCGDWKPCAVHATIVRAEQAVLRELERLTLAELAGL